MSRASTRELAVELLRCAADMETLVGAGYALGHCDGIHPCSPVYTLASATYENMPGIIHGGGYHAYREQLLEAAQRLEDQGKGKKP